MHSEAAFREHIRAGRLTPTSMVTLYVGEEDGVLVPAIDVPELVPLFTELLPAERPAPRPGRRQAAAEASEPEQAPEPAPAEPVPPAPALVPAAGKKPARRKGAGKTKSARRKPAASAARPGRARQPAKTKPQAPAAEAALAASPEPPGTKAGAPAPAQDGSPAEPPAAASETASPADDSEAEMVRAAADAAAVAGVADTADTGGQKQKKTPLFKLSLVALAAAAFGAVALLLAFFSRDKTEKFYPFDTTDVLERAESTAKRVGVLQRGDFDASGIVSYDDAGNAWVQLSSGSDGRAQYGGKYVSRQFLGKEKPTPPMERFKLSLKPNPGGGVLYERRDKAAPSRIVGSDREVRLVALLSGGWVEVATPDRGVEYALQETFTIPAGPPTLSGELAVLDNGRFEMGGVEFTLVTRAGGETRGLENPRTRETLRIHLQSVRINGCQRRERAIYVCLYNEGNDLAAMINANQARASSHNSR